MAFSPINLITFTVVVKNCLKSPVKNSMNGWESSVVPIRFIDRLTSQAVLSHCEFQAFIEPEINDQKYDYNVLLDQTSTNRSISYLY